MRAGVEGRVFPQGLRVRRWWEIGIIAEPRRILSYRRADYVAHVYRGSVRSGRCTFVALRSRRGQRSPMLTACRSWREAFTAAREWVCAEA